MKCLHCLVTVLPLEESHEITEDLTGKWKVSSSFCPSCRRSTFTLFCLEVRNGIHTGRRIEEYTVYPLSSGRPPCPVEVPENLAEDYKEACVVLPFSPKASAALSRRCLQSVLRTCTSCKHGNLNSEIVFCLDNERWPAHLHEVVDSIRKIGNFAAHPTPDKSTGEILPVDPEEAEWTLEILEALFDFYFVQPAKNKIRLEALKNKLNPPSK